MYLGVWMKAMCTDLGHAHIARELTQPLLQSQPEFSDMIHIKSAAIPGSADIRSVASNPALNLKITKPKFKSNASLQDRYKKNDKTVLSAYKFSQETH